jgi:hypothetical protein
MRWSFDIAKIREFILNNVLRTTKPRTGGIAI